MDYYQIASIAFIGVFALSAVIALLRTATNAPERAKGLRYEGEYTRNK